MRRRLFLSDANYEAMFSLGVFTLASVGAIVGITLWLTGGGSGGDSEAAPEPPAATAPATTGTATEPAATEPAATEPAASEPADTSGGEPGSGGDAAAGAEIFASAGCGSCHTLAAAGSTGTVGPDLDATQPPLDLVVERVTNGAPPMPAFKDSLSEQQILDVAAYVVESTSG